MVTFGNFILLHHKYKIFDYLKSIFFFFYLLNSKHFDCKAINKFVKCFNLILEVTKHVSVKNGRGARCYHFPLSSDRLNGLKQIICLNLLILNFFFTFTRIALWRFNSGNVMSLLRDMKSLWPFLHSFVASHCDHCVKS